MHICMSWLTPFTSRKAPQPPTRGRGPGMAQGGGRGPPAAPHGLGKGRRKCPVKYSIAPVGRGHPEGSAAPRACPGSRGTCESSPGLPRPEESPDSPPPGSVRCWSAACYVAMRGTSLAAMGNGEPSPPLSTRYSSSSFSW